jgi:ribose-phosphate pyrophosphokinase
MFSNNKGDLNGLVITSSTPNDEFAKKISTYLGHPLCKTERIDFRDSDIKVRISDNESVRGKDVYLIMTSQPPISKRLQELIVWTDSLISGSAERVTLVLPYLFGSRQDRKTRRGEPINIRAYINALLGVAREHGSKVGFMTADLHSEQMQALAMYFDNLTALPVFAHHTKTNYPSPVIVAPDAGGLKKAEKLAESVNAEGLAWIAKTRPAEGESETYGISGDSLKDKTAIIIDDIIDSAGTLKKGCEALKKAGANQIIVYATHLLLNDPAEENIRNMNAKIIGTDTVCHEQEKLKSLNITSIPFSRIFAEAIKRKHLGQSTRDLFKENTAASICGLTHSLK